jgi:pimeloyl-ACP methyl ester carboxylesterase
VEDVMARTFLSRGFGRRAILLAAVMVFVTSCAEKVPEGQTRCVQSFDGETITYNVYGSGDVTLVFVHGWSCDSRYWREQVPYFAKKYRVVTMDLAGHGNSSMGRKIYSVGNFAQDVKAVIEAINAQKVIVIGHSFGGEIVATAARQEAKKIIGIIGVDTLQNVEEWYSREEAGKLIGLDGFKKDFRASVKTFVEQMMVKDMNPELKKWIIDDMSSAPANIGVSALEEYTGTIADKKMISVFKEVKAPVRCINADLWPTKPEANRKYMQSFDVAIMKGVGHFLMLERPEEFNRLLEKSIQQIVRNGKF